MSTRDAAALGQDQNANGQTNDPSMRHGNGHNYSDKGANGYSHEEVRPISPKHFRHAKDCIVGWSSTRKPRPYAFDHS